MISTDIINSIFPRDTLNDIETDLENDLALFLEWISFKPPLMDPSPRIRVAIKNVVNINNFNGYLHNSINNNFPDITITTIDETMMNIKQVYQFYSDIGKFLGLDISPIINYKFQILLEKPQFQHLLITYFDDNLLQFDDCLSPVSPKFNPPAGDKGLKGDTGDTFFYQYLPIFNQLNVGDNIMKIVVSVLIKKIKEYILNNCVNYELFFIDSINQWIKTMIYPNFKILLRSIDANFNYLSEILTISHNEFISLRINQIFDMVKAYPQSEPGLIELNKCLNFKNESHNQRDRLVSIFLDKIDSELLNSGINTINLIKMYIKIIKSFLIIDAKGVLLDKVIRPLRAYLKHRDDIIQKLVIGLIDDSSSNELIALNIELSKSEKRKLKIDEFSDLNWVPDPIDALPDFKNFKIKDIIESLISIFDSKEIFINEFTKFFGNKLINRSDNDISKILKLINLLKLRFGKNEFFNLDIMIQDILNSSPQLTVLSHLYWSDIIPESTGSVHEELNKEFAHFNKNFQKKSFNRYLKMIPELSKVTLKVNGKNYQVDMHHASVIMMFKDKEEVGLDEVVRELNMNEYNAGNVLKFWVEEGVLLKLGGVYVTND
ncbi:hypothetical protein CLIB1444_23S00782 [[Candida] jaroonii]|uniref:Uncharacterized protein n=1 Tax=[Candida] jaroonii TaxID=467808 RepID=A0ACA9YFR3_9ASCO|nr:hypothetical protein CLIB1444_23S00782 [[Candida] jaroonii]